MKYRFAALRLLLVAALLALNVRLDAG
jgi:hypothetical protein